MDHASSADNASPSIGRKRHLAPALVRVDELGINPLTFYSADDRAQRVYTYSSQVSVLQTFFSIRNVFWVKANSLLVDEQIKVSLCNNNNIINFI